MTRIKQLTNIALPLLLLTGTLILPGASASGVREGAKLACTAALPALFPALVLSRLLSSSGLKGGRFLPLILGLCCGFPIGALTVCNLLESGAVSPKCARRMLICCCNTGPAFIIGYCGRMILNDVKAGVLIYLAECLTAILLFVLLVPKENVPKRTVQEVSLHQAISDAAVTFLTIAGCIVFFSFLNTLILTVVPGMRKIGGALIAMLFEITGGMANTVELPFSLAFPLCAAGIGWGGLSVYLQTSGPLRKAGLGVREYLIGRALFTLLLLLLSFPIKKLL